MKHCHVNLCCNELPFLKQKLPFLYKFFDQIIIIDYDILNNCNSKDGSIEYINNFNDYENKITLLTKFDFNNITNYNGVSMIEKQKMFAYCSKFINDTIDIIWATDLDEFFNSNLINIIENKYHKDPNLISIDVPHKIFCYNQYNIFNYNRLFYIKPRITKHFKNKIYGHCNFETYGKTLKLEKYFLYHFSYVGYHRCKHKLILFNTKTTSKHMQNEWLTIYFNHLKNNDKYVNLVHPGNRCKTIKYNNSYPDYINMDEMIKDLNII